MLHAYLSKDTIKNALALSVITFKEAIELLDKLKRCKTIHTN